VDYNDSNKVSGEILRTALSLQADRTYNFEQQPLGLPELLLVTVHTSSSLNLLWESNKE
jgi:hypothetical protein